MKVPTSKQNAPKVGEVRITVAGAKFGEVMPNLDALRVGLESGGWGDSLVR